MPAPKGTNPPAKGRGRPKGALNKTTAAAKDIIASVATELGGAERLLAWVKADPKNEAAYWTVIHPKLLPLQVNGSGDEGEHKFVVTWLK